MTFLRHKYGKILSGVFILLKENLKTHRSRFKLGDDSVVLSVPGQHTTFQFHVERRLLIPLQIDI